MTFVVTASIGFFATIVFLNRLACLVVVFLKAAILISPLLATYWISARGDSRAATDAMFLAGLKTVLGGRWWPQKLRTWADKIQAG